MKKIIIITALILATMTTIAYAAIYGGSNGVFTDNASPGTDIRIHAGVIRDNNSPDWYLLDDAGHEPLNLQDPECNATTGLLEIDFPTASKIGAFLVTPDETWAEYGYDVGATVSYTQVKIAFAKNGTKYHCDNTNLHSVGAYSSGNFWVYGITYP